MLVPDFITLKKDLQEFKECIPLEKYSFISNVNEGSIKLLSTFSDESDLNVIHQVLAVTMSKSTLETKKSNAQIACGNKPLR